MQNPSKSQDPEWTILKLLKWTTSYFKTHNIDSPRATAEILLAHVLKLKRIDLYLRFDQPLVDKELSRLKTLIKRRIKREPVAYIVGIKEFWSLELAVTKDVLIPRPETECLVEAALDLLPEIPPSNPMLNPKRILELGTGSGAITLALASMRPNHLFFASDCSMNAVKLAQKNAKYHGLDTSIHFFCADWFKALTNNAAGFDIIISNPPYIPTQTIAHLQPEIYQYEPISAMDGKQDGLASLKHIIKKAHEYLHRQGRLLMEIGHDQKNAVQKIIESCGMYKDVIFSKDYSGYDRIVQMQKKCCESKFNLLGKSV
ncbi:MAG: peptide chain release factor N(5)-glutamine methyltransferase [Desulfobacterales bacterium]|nr:MAG: peptide chain release factor N(5)-glutamine methyltransferase [Desulfobacterales bacterium]